MAAIQRQLQQISKLLVETSALLDVFSKHNEYDSCVGDMDYSHHEHDSSSGDVDFFSQPAMSRVLESWIFLTTSNGSYVRLNLLL